PIQEKAIPFILQSNKDLIALAQNGTGKTAAFSLPILHQIKINEKDLQAIILCPTRELCIQIFQNIKKFAHYSKGITVTAVYGGARIDLQINSLKSGINIVVGTPGRVHDLIRRKILKLQSIKWLVLDEADEMLDMGFKDDVDAILEQTPKTRQTLLFSATMSRSVQSIAKQYMGDAQEIRIGEKNIGAEKVTHVYYVIQARDRFEALKRILDYLPGVYGILFCRTRNETQIVADKLKQAHYDTEALHGDISQSMRTKIMHRFKRKQVRLLVATDVASRGIDVSNLSHVINYNLPDQNEVYTHRSGRTGRAQKSGVSISIVTPREVRRIKRLENVIGKKFEYKKVPNREDILGKQIDSFLTEIETTDIKGMGNERYFSEVVDRLKKIKKEDLIKQFIALKFNYLIDGYKDTRDVNAYIKAFGGDKRDRDNVSLKINLGKNHGFHIKELFTLINSNKNLKGIGIGRISLMPEYSIFSVEKNRVNEVIENLKGTNFKGKKIDIVRSNIKASYPRKRQGRAGRGFVRKKGRGLRRIKKFL
ncbi:DEAD/DEAH box helicase, partial [Patescibacteria group bacterium AH-259-L07]|nr:DEAD/DEAH box helicase [Patescibacteria group bacterium AH-259-L07]